jgi:hypothetical protein
MIVFALAVGCPYGGQCHQPIIRRLNEMPLPKVLRILSCLEKQGKLASLVVAHHHCSKPLEVEGFSQYDGRLQLRDILLLRLLADPAS